MKKCKMEKAEPCSANFLQKHLCRKCPHLLTNKTNTMYYRKNPLSKKTIQHSESYEGETIEKKIQRLVNNKEPLTDSAPLIFTDRKDGIEAAYDIRTDRWEIATDAMDKVTQHHQQIREQSIGERTYDTMTEDKQKEFNKKYPKNKHAITAANKDTGESKA